MTIPLPNLPFGSMPNGLSLTPDGKFLLVALAGSNAIAVHDASSPQLRIRGFVPTAWYPTGLVCNSDSLFIANTKGFGIQRLARYSCRDYPGWNMQIPDVLRMDRFLAEFRQFESEGGLPNLSIVYLPQDHLGGGITGRSHMADHDLALGRLVEAVSNSTYWPETLIIVNEDDPQNGFDHIDGHRSLCLVISAYSQPGVNHDFFNQTAVLRTILHTLGLPPINQQVSAAPLMTSCFSETPNNLAPYKALTPNVPLNEAPQPVSMQSSQERYWREIVSQVPIERTGMKTPIHEDQLNRFISHEQQGWETQYPEHFAGPHGSGLRALGLRQE